MAGFFGPILLNPDANQGPLLGLFITGPGGAIGGLILGALLRVLPIPNPLKWRTLFVGAALFAIVTLYFCLPEPQLRGTAIEAHMVECTPSERAIDAAVEHWETRIASVTWAPPRADWKQEIPRMLREEPGVVVRMQLERENRIYELRRPWNRGRLTASGWRRSTDLREYFARTSCDDPALTATHEYLPTGTGSSEWPPSDLPNLLGVQVLEAVPDNGSIRSVLVR